MAHFGDKRIEPAEGENSILADRVFNRQPIPPAPVPNEVSQQLANRVFDAPRAPPPVIVSDSQLILAGRAFGRPSVNVSGAAAPSPATPVDDSSAILAGQVFARKTSVSSSTSSSSGLVNFTEAVTTASPNATVPVVSLKATNGATNVDAVLGSKGTGGLGAQVADNGTTGGNKRGANAVDWQQSRTVNTHVASGALSVVGGGLKNTASGAQSVVSGGDTNSAQATNTSVGGGASNSASTSGARVGGGTSNTASGSTSTVAGGASNNASGGGGAIGGGGTNTASGTNSAVPGGSTNTASGDYSIATGLQATTRAIQGAAAHSSGGHFGTLGAAQTEVFHQRMQTTDATVTALSADGATVVAATGIVLPNTHSYTYSALVIARENTSGDTAGFKVEGVIRRGANAAATALVGSPTITALGADAGASTWAATAAANTTLGALVINVTGEIASTIRWSARIETAETNAA